MRITDAVFSALRETSRRHAAARSQRRTLRAVEELPQHVLKDIGWPGAQER